MFRIIQKKKIWFIISGLIIIPGIVAILSGGIKLGIDFTGGSLLRLNFTEQNPSLDSVEQTVAGAINSDDVRAQPLGEDEISVRLPRVDSETHQTILKKLEETYGRVEELSFESIGPTIGQELRQKAILAIILVLLFIIIYISIAFRKASSGKVKSWVYGLGALIALFHDLMVVVGVFAILGLLLNVEIDILFITALLTVLGFSVHDTIVVYDRVRERLKVSPKKTFEEVVNESVNQTLVRSINTSVTTLLVLAALYLFGGESIRYFVLALLIGITAGTYSSIFIASPILVVWHNFSNRH